MISGGRIRLVRFARSFASAKAPIVSELENRIQALANSKTQQFTELKKKHGSKVVGDVTVDMVMGGMRGIKSMVTETSDLDALEGIRYRGHDLYECNEKLPKAPNGECGLPEASFWLLLTGEIPTEAQTNALNEEFRRRSHVSEEVLKQIDALPKSMHPMTQLSIGILALQPTSKFQKAYNEGVKKSEYWTHTLDDSLSLIAEIPVVAARIYRNVFHNGVHIEADPSLDWAGNYAHMLGVSDSEGFKEITRLYLMLHADHEGGNVSAHTTHLVGSALSDPYYSWAAGVCGLAGPLHGLANQESLKWLEQTMRDLNGQEATVEVITEYAKQTLAAGKVIPGYGHAVLRNTDPRYMLEREYALKHMTDDDMVKLVSVCYDAIPPVLEATGKVKNPFPNVDAHSGVCMQYYGLKEPDYYTVVFAVSRTLGVMAQLVWSRVMGMPIERPKSVTLDYLSKTASKL